MGAMTVTMTSGDGIRKEGARAGSARRGGQARVAFAYARDLVGRSTGLWIAYAIAWLLVLVFPLALVGGSPYGATAKAMPSVWQGEYGIALIGCAIGAVAAAVRSFPYAQRSAEADFAGALPCKRSALFAGAALAGFVPLVAVELAVAAVIALLALAMPVIGLAGCARWLELAVLFTFVFYATALLCVQLSGTASAATWLFIGANLFIVVVELVVRAFAGYLVWGLAFGPGVTLGWTSPLVGMGMYGFPDGGGEAAVTGVLYVPFGAQGVDVAGGVTSLYPVDWSVLGLYCAAGAAFALAAFLLNGVRPFERAGETVCYRWERVVLACAGGLIGMLVLGACAALIAANATGEPLSGAASVAVAASMGVGAFLGCVFAAAYVHGESGGFRIPWKLGCAAGCVALAVGLGCAFDALGLESRVPDVGNVSRVEVTGFSGQRSVRLGESENVGAVTGAHRAILGLEADARQASLAAGENAPATTSVSFAYTLQDGSTLRRSYTIPVEGKKEQAALASLTGAFNSEEGVESRIAGLRAVGAKNLEIDYTPSGESVAHELTAEEKVAFIEGPLQSDALGHGVLDVDFVEDEDDAGVGSLGEMDIMFTRGEEPSINVPVSKKGSPSIYRWLKAEDLL